MSGEAFDIPTNQIREFCRLWHIRELALFGSVLRPDFRPESDIDVLVSFDPSVRHTLTDEVQMETDLEKILGRRVDLVDRKAVENSPNPIRKRHILNSLKVVHVEG